MRLSSPLPKNAYLAAIKSQMEGHFDFGSDRFTGFFLCNCFYVTYHSGFEWNRRYTNQKNAAMGYVKKTDDGCEVRFMRFRGLLCPLQFLSAFFWVALLMILKAAGEGIHDIRAIWMGLGWGFLFTLIASPISALFESFTDKSEEGRRYLLSLLLDPVDPFANVNKIP